MAVSAVATVFLLAERFGAIGDWTRPQLLFMLGYGLLVRGVLVAFFSFNISHISRRIGRGQLDHSLIQPLPLWMSLLVEGFMPVSGSGVLLGGVLLTAYALSSLPGYVTLGWSLLLGLNVVSSVAVLMAFNILWASLAFWAPRAAEEINSSTTRLMVQLKQYPLDGMGALAGAGLLTVLPVGLLAWLPARALLGLDSAPWALWATPIAAVAFVAAAVWAFRKGLEQYGRTGSTRYLSHGFRR
jgi:ABC-2 type transport system permease protein